MPLVAGGFKVLGEPAGVVRTQAMQQYRGGTWKNNDHLWWTNAKPGDLLEVAVPVKKSGTGQVEGYVPVIVRSADGGILAFAVDDGNTTGNWQPRHESPEAAMAWYEEHEPAAWLQEPPEWGHLQRRHTAASDAPASTA